MDANLIIQVVSTVGFPIVMCIMMAYYIKNVTQAYREDIKSLQKSVDNNTAIMEKVLDKLEEEKNVTGN